METGTLTRIHMQLQKYLVIGMFLLQLQKDNMGWKIKNVK
jgi:hypothetical protein